MLNLPRFKDLFGQFSFIFLSFSSIEFSIRLKASFFESRSILTIFLFEMFSKASLKALRIKHNSAHALPNFILALISLSCFPIFLLKISSIGPLSPVMTDFNRTWSSRVRLASFALSIDCSILFLYLFLWFHSKLIQGFTDSEICRVFFWRKDFCSLMFLRTMSFLEGTEAFWVLSINCSLVRKVCWYLFK